MKKLIIFLGVLLFSANLINVNFFQQADKLDILFSLDSKFNGKVIEIAHNQFLIKKVISTNEYYKKFENFFIKEVKILPKQSGVLVILNIKGKYKTSVALTPDGYGIRFRVEKLIKPVDTVAVNISNKNYNNYDRLDYVSYIVSVVVLIIIGIILFLFKKRIRENLGGSDIKVLFQKPLDPKNKIVLVEFNQRRYLLVIGNSNILLDIFDENMVNISTKEEFDRYLKEEVDNRLDYLKDYIENAEKLKELNEKV